MEGSIKLDNIKANRMLSVTQPDSKVIQLVQPGQLTHKSNQVQIMSGAFFLKELTSKWGSALI